MAVLTEQNSEQSGWPGANGSPVQVILFFLLALACQADLPTGACICMCPVQTRALADTEEGTAVKGHKAYWAITHKGIFNVVKSNLVSLDAARMSAKLIGGIEKATFCFGTFLSLRHVCIFV